MVNGTEFNGKINGGSKDWLIKVLIGVLGLVLGSWTTLMAFKGDVASLATNTAINTTEILGLVRADVKHDKEQSDMELKFIALMNQNTELIAELRAYRTAGRTGR